MQKYFFNLTIHKEKDYYFPLQNVHKILYSQARDYRPHAFIIKLEQTPTDHFSGYKTLNITFFFKEMVTIILYFE